MFTTDKYTHRSLGLMWANRENAILEYSEMANEENKAFIYVRDSQTEAQLPAREA